jgi:hypothetical protein
MNRIPAKQIYLLTIIIVGIIALSVYSTYALFTFESETSNVVTIHTPTSLQISENIYEYQQIKVEKNSVVTIDIDIYNSFDYDVCYSIWYKIIGEYEEEKVQIFQKSKELLTSSGILLAQQNIRVTVVIINDNENEIKINLGTVADELKTDSCSLNISEEKKVISKTYEKTESLNELILSQSKEKEIEDKDGGYYIHEDDDKTLTYKNTDKIIISNKFIYKDELFTLEEPVNLTIDEIIKEKYLEENEKVYYCQGKDKCQILYEITKLEKQKNDSDSQLVAEPEKEVYYDITLSNKMIGYSSGPNGIKKVNNQDYIFYGDNPNNYIYYNCKNDDTTTCELWRIVGLYYNEETEKYNIKIVKNDSIGKYQFETEETEKLVWTDSNLYKKLTGEDEENNEEINTQEESKRKKEYEIYTEKFKQRIETLESVDKEINLEKETLDSKINLLTLSDYVHTSNCKINSVTKLNKECIKKSWLNDIEIGNTWTLTYTQEIEIIEEPEPEVSEEENLEVEENNQEIPEENPAEDNEELNDEVVEEEPKEIIVNYVYSVGNDIEKNKITDELEVRPVLYLKSRILLVAGEGTFNNPYIIK